MGQEGSKVRGSGVSRSALQIVRSAEVKGQQGCGRYLVGIRGQQISKGMRSAEVKGQQDFRRGQGSAGCLRNEVTVTYFFLFTGSMFVYVSISPANDHLHTHAMQV